VESVWKDYTVASGTYADLRLLMSLFFSRDEFGSLAAPQW